MLSLLLIEMGIKILSAKIGGRAEEIAKIPGLLRKIVIVLNKLSVEETGQSIDWDNITEQEHFQGNDSK